MCKKNQGHNKNNLDKVISDIINKKRNIKSPKKAAASLKKASSGSKKAVSPKGGDSKGSSDSKEVGKFKVVVI